MTAPISSALTAPVRDRVYWTSVLHNAAQVPPEHPRYGEARAVIQMALDSMGAANAKASEADIQAMTPGKLGSALVSFGHGASLGLAGDKTYLGLAREAHPFLTTGADIAGTVALGGIAAPLVAGLSPVAGGAVLGGTTAALRGTFEPLPGFTRLESAALLGTGGAVTGAVAGKIVGKLVPMARTISRNVVRTLGRAASPQEVGTVSEAAVRAELARLNVRPEMIERTVVAWKTGKIPTTPVSASPPPPPEPLVLRPGETVTPIAGQPRGFAVTGPRATPPIPTAPTLLEMQQGHSQGPTSLLETLGRGKTLPYYTRGGATEQAMAPPPTASSPPATGPLQLKQLQVLVQLPESEFEQVSSLFPKAVIDQLRVVRTQLAAGKL